MQPDLNSIDILTENFLLDNGKLKSVKKSSLKFASEEKNRTKLVQIIINYLEKNDPKNADVKYATKLVEKMQLFARKKLEELSKK